MHCMMRRKTGDVDWHFQRHCPESWFSPRGILVPSRLASGQAQIVKDGSHRTVYRIDLPERALFVKHYRCTNTLAALRHWWRPCAAQREWRAAVQIARRGVSTIDVIGYGRRERFGLVRDNYLVTRAIEPSCSLDEYVLRVLPRLDPRTAADARRRLIEELARLCATMHSRGILHRDLHTGNILVQLDEGAELAGATRAPRLYLIDLASARFTGALGWRRSRKNLAMLCTGWLGRLSPAELWRFWQVYLAARPEWRRVDARRRGREIVERAAQRAQRVARARDKRSLGDNRDFFRLRTGHARGHAIRAMAADQLATWLADPEQPLRDYWHRPLKLSHGSVVVEGEWRLGRAATRVSLKRYREKHWWKLVLGLFRRGRAVRGWYVGHALLARGIATARPIAACIAGPWYKGAGYLVTARIDGARDLHSYGWDLAERPVHERRRRVNQLARSLGRLVGRLHRWRIAHRDLKGCNFMVVETERDVEVFLVDLDGIRIRPRLGQTVRAANLARLATSLCIHRWVPRTAVARFFEAYRREDVLASGDHKRLWRRVASQSARIKARRRRFGHVLA